MRAIIFAGRCQISIGRTRREPKAPRPTTAPTPQGEKGKEERRPTGRQVWVAPLEDAWRRRINCVVLLCDIEKKDKGVYPALRPHHLPARGRFRPPLSLRFASLLVFVHVERLAGLVRDACFTRGVRANP